MDSLTQFVLGSAVGIAVSPVKSPKIALISGVIATLPDLDIFIPYADDLTKTIQHRTFSHSLIYLTLFAPFLAMLLHKIFKTISYYKWVFLSFSVLVTHSLLDGFTIYGTAWFLPFSQIRVMIGSIFIIDPLYTLPLLFAMLYLLIKKSAKYNTFALVFSTLYLIWTFTAAQIITPSGKAFATPTPFNSYLWRVVEVKNDEISQYFINIFGEKSAVKKIENQQKLFNNHYVKKYANFSSGFYNFKIVGDELVLYDLRMGNIFTPVFSFVMAKKVDGKWQEIVPKRNMFKLENSFNLSSAFGRE